MCCCDCIVRIWCNIQLWLIRRLNCMTSPILSIMYMIDLFLYSSGGPEGPKKFLSSRGRILGKNFASLGKIIVGEYAEVVKIIQSPQLRGFYLGRARLVSSRLPENFLLALSDKDANPEAVDSDLHERLHEHFWTFIVPSAVERIDNDPAFSTYITEAVKATRNVSEAAASDIIARMSIRYVFHAIFGSSLVGHKDVEDVIVTLFIGNGPFDSYVGGAIDPVAKFLCCLQCPRRSNISKMKKLILASPLLESHTPSFENGNMGADEYAEWMIALTGVAGFIGVKTMCVQVMFGVPSDAEIDLENRRVLMLAVLEAARIQAPVNNVNVILPTATSMIVNGKQCSFRAGTVVAGSIGLASLDKDEFEEPLTFNMERTNLMSSTVNFNSIGFDPNGAGRRTCPGRNIAMKLACDFLLEHRSTQQGYTPP